MNEKEIHDFLSEFKDSEFRYVLRQSNHLSGGDIEKYDLVYVDKNGIFVTVNPVDKSFYFKYVTNKMFVLKSGSFSPLDYPNHFKRNYINFVNTALCLVDM